MPPGRVIRGEREEYEKMAQRGYDSAWLMMTFTAYRYTYLFSGDRDGGTPWISIGRLDVSSTTSLRYADSCLPFSMCAGTGDRPIAVS